MQPETKAGCRWQEFETELRRREAEIATLLPSHISRERFLNTAIIAAKNNQDLVLCDRRSLHAAITKAAEDGLQPDGREGVINIYNEQRERKTGTGNAVEKYWVKVACWIPMTHGIRKRARELCGMIIDAQVVHENDVFKRQQGDEPKIVHEPAQLGTPRGKMIGAYAIYKQGGEILHREVMDASQIEKVKSCVKAKNGLLWTTFEDEAWRKTVLRRGIKTVPSVPDALQRIVSRDDDQYDFSGGGKIAEGQGHIPAELPEIPDIAEEAPEPLAALEDANRIADEDGFLSNLEEELSYGDAVEVWVSNEHMLERLSPEGQRRMIALKPKIVEAAE